MGGVDKHDQMLTYYSLSRKAVKWYKKYFFHLFDICIFNACCLYRREEANKSVSHLKFRERLAEEILEITGPHPAARLHRQPPVRRSEGPRPERLTERHFPSLIPLTDAAKERGDRKKHHKNCVLCPKPLYADKPFSRSRTEFECKKCNVALCAAPCFQKYHTISQL